MKKEVVTRGYAIDLLEKTLAEYKKDELVELLVNEIIGLGNEYATDNNCLAKQIKLYVGKDYFIVDDNETTEVLYGK